MTHSHPIQQPLGHIFCEVWKPGNKEQSKRGKINSVSLKLGLQIPWLITNWLDLSGAKLHRQCHQRQRATGRFESSRIRVPIGAGTISVWRNSIKKTGSMLVWEQLRTYPSPNPTITLSVNNQPSVDCWLRGFDSVGVDFTQWETRARARLTNSS